MAKYVFFHRHGFGCRWWGTWDMVWSWRRSRSVNIILYPSSSSSRLMRCSWTTSAPNATNFARSWLVCTCVDKYDWILQDVFRAYRVMSASVIKIIFNFSMNKQAWVTILYQQYSRTVQFTFIAVCYRYHKPQQCLLCLSEFKQAYFWSCRVEKYFIGLNRIKWMTLESVYQDGWRLLFRNRHIRLQNFQRAATSESTSYMIGQFEPSEVIGQIFIQQAHLCLQLLKLRQKDIPVNNIILMHSSDRTLVWNASGAFFSDSLTFWLQMTLGFSSLTCAYCKEPVWPLNPAVPPFCCRSMVTFLRG